MSYVSLGLVGLSVATLVWNLLTPFDIPLWFAAWSLGLGMSALIVGMIYAICTGR